MKARLGLQLRCESERRFVMVVTEEDGVTNQQEGAGVRAFITQEKGRVGLSWRNLEEMKLQRRLIKLLPAFPVLRRSLKSGRSVPRSPPPCVGQRGRPRVAGGERNTTPRPSKEEEASWGLESARSD
ncbi:hypothetical protein ILYODFUR_005229 [Ilyodon furcidens]|uniref:Uncharacterized protein n=1 Tax=Ilyodon furcidens TaxID=33524 RepID=A0ABV0UGD9_9TELE